MKSCASAAAWRAYQRRRPSARETLSGEIIDLEITIERSPGTTFYLLTAVPLIPTLDTFVYDNPFTDEKPPFHEGDAVGYFGARRHRLHRNHPVGAGPRQNSPLSGLRL